MKKATFLILVIICLFISVVLTFVSETITDATALFVMIDIALGMVLGMIIADEKPIY
jgi:hypothetical protein